MRCGHVARIGEIRNAYKNVGWKVQMKENSRKTQTRWGTKKNGC
jgi:hypothetical protein